jgi:membrane protein required for beta-lactamase induction
MLEIMFWISAKKIVVAFALLGAVFVAIAPKIGTWAQPLKNSGSAYSQRLSPQNVEKFLIRAGYTFVGLSITLFIIAGFIVDLR